MKSCKKQTSNIKLEQFHYYQGLMSVVCEYLNKMCSTNVYRSGTVNLKSFVSKDFLQIKWKFELNYASNSNFGQNFKLKISLN